MKILIADDDTISRHLTQKVLERAGYEVLAVENGVSAVKSLAGPDCPRLALLDWVMPGLDGPSVCRMIRTRYDQPYIFMILLTSKKSKEDIVAGLESGADDYLIKPYHPEELKARLRAGQRILQLQDKLIHDAHHDPLTQLPNRKLFLERLSHCIRRSRQSNEYKFAVLFVDLDRFKNVNDTYGHAAGDQLIVEVSKRLRSSIRQDSSGLDSADTTVPRRPSGEDSLARLGGDEFTILLEDIRDTSDAIRVAERIQKNFATTFSIAGHDFLSSASIGIAVSASGYSAAQDMLRDADTAMYRAKSLGKSRYEICDPAMHRAAVSRLNLENDLRKAIEGDELRVHYQPIVSLQDLRIVGFEALVRWQRPDSELTMPGEFVNVAEETGLILPIGDWVLREACRQIHDWHAQFPSVPPFSLAVNVSAKQFADPGLVSRVDQILRETSLEPSSLKLELTESIAMKEVELTAEVLNTLKAIGVRLSIDDFGTGYSSLSYLNRFRFDTLKIDRSFISQMGQSAESRKIVQSIISLAHNIGMQVVAEGVETADQSNKLESWSCEYAQGYLFSKPIDKVGLARLLLSSSGNDYRLAQRPLVEPVPMLS
jgi:diguanylate cyclase (GGDEF)-like protein